jgi:hypothetical protein
VGAFDRPKLARAIKELDEVSIATSITGTSKSKVNQILKMVKPMLDGLVGDRPEVAKLRRRLRMAMHNLRRSRVDQRASRRMRDLLSVVRDLQKLIDQRGLGDVPAEALVGPFEVINAWGYSDAELKPLLRVLKDADKALGKVGLRVETLPLMLDPREMGRGRGQASRYAVYDPQDDLLVVNPDEKLSGDLEAVLAAVATRLWFEELKLDDYAIWDNGGGLDGFREGFARKLATGRVDSDTGARLSITVGRIAKRWPSAA